MTAPSPRVSVLITTRNRAHLVGRAIESALHQTFPDFELLVVDDASRDATRETVARYGDPRVRYLRLDRQRGVGGARNDGIAQSRGEWVAFLDDDDEWLPEKLEREMARVDEAADPAVAVVQCRCYRKGRSAEGTVIPKDPLPEGDALRAVLNNRRTVTASALVVKRGALAALGGFDEALPSGDDFDLLIRLAVNGYRFVAVQEPLVIKHNLEGWQITTDPFRRLQAVRMLDERWGKLMIDERGTEQYGRWIEKRLETASHLHAGYVRQLVAEGRRVAALRYALKMARFFPWGGRHATEALLFGLFGRGGGTARLASFAVLAGFLAWLSRRRAT